jgi:nucleoid-associated protein YgaU
MSVWKKSMDHRIRLIAASAVMLVGIGLALCFRRAAGEAALTIPVQGNVMDPGRATRSPAFAAELGSATGYPAPPTIGHAVPRPLPVAAQEPPRSSPAIVTASDQPAPPPEFAKSYPGDNQLAGSRWGTSLAAMLPGRTSPPQTHKIVDGDTLPALAKRYLGSASRANEIYDANRGVLADPKILRIGALLTIPHGEQ